MNYLEVSNSVGMWLACLPLLAVIITQSVMIYRRAQKSAKLVSLTPQEQKAAFRTGLITAIGPSFSSFIVIIAMSAVMGAPITWQRTSIIASASTELRASQYTAEAMGVVLGGEGFTMTAFDACLWVMALNGCGWLIMCLLFTDKMSIVQAKITGGSKALLGAFATAAILATMMYMSSSYILSRGAGLVALLTAAAGRYLLDTATKNHPKIRQWNFGLALLIGMFCGQMYTFIRG